MVGLAVILHAPEFRKTRIRTAYSMMNYFDSGILTDYSLVKLRRVSFSYDYNQDLLPS